MRGLRWWWYCKRVSYSCFPRCGCHTHSWQLAHGQGEIRNHHHDCRFWYGSESVHDRFVVWEPSVVWKPPLDTFWLVSNIFESDVDVIQISCFTGSTGFVHIYVGRLMIFPIVCCLAFLGSFVLSEIQSTKRFSNCTC